VRREDARLFLRWSERWRATALRVTPVRPPPDSELVADLAALRNVAARLDSAPDGRSAAPALERERRRLEAAVRQRVLHTPAVAVRDAEPFITADLLEQLGDTDLLELTDVDGQLYAVVIAGGRLRLEHVGLTPEALHSLAHALFALRREGSRRGTYRLDLAEIGLRLEMKLLGGSVRLLRGGPVVVVPTGRLHAVPWGLMPSLRERATAVAPSASAWLQARRAAQPTKPRVVLVGGPRLATGDAEVRRLAAQYPDAVVLAEGSAVTERVMAAMDGAWLVHMAAHGTFRADSPLFSAIELDDGPLTVVGQRLPFFRRREFACFGGQPRWVVLAAGQLFGKGGHLRAVLGYAALDYSVDQAVAQCGGGTDRQAFLGEPGRLLRADAAGQGVAPVLRAVQAHQLVVRVEDRAGPAPVLVGGEREHHAPGGGVTRERRHGELAGGGQDCLHQVVDGVDVAPGLCRGIVGGLDYVQVDAVGEEVPGAAEHDHPYGAGLGGPVGSAGTLRGQLRVPVFVEGPKRRYRLAR
jgi:hypothetical protein